MTVLHNNSLTIKVWFSFWESDCRSEGAVFRASGLSERVRLTKSPEKRDAVGTTVFGLGCCLIVFRMDKLGTITGLFLVVLGILMLLSRSNEEAVQHVKLLVGIESENTEFRVISARDKTSAETALPVERNV